MLEKLFPKSNKHWITEDSIFKSIVDNIDEDGQLNESRVSLENHFLDDMLGVQLAPGLHDAMLPYDEEAVEKKGQELVSLLANIAVSGKEEEYQQFYDAICDEDTVPCIDFVMTQLGELDLPVTPYLYFFAKNLAFKTNQASAIKYGLAILGLCTNRSVIPNLHLIAKHNEFTIYAAIAICNLTEDPVTDLVQIVKNVYGWGRIRVVNLLCSFELKQEVLDWLALEGFRNDIMNEYLAFTVADRINLLERLKLKNIPEEFLDAYGDIMDALIESGPAKGIQDYQDAASLIQAFLDQLLKAELNLDRLYSAVLIFDYLEHLKEHPEEMQVGDWTPDSLANCLIDSSQILNNPLAKKLCEEDLLRLNEMNWKSVDIAEYFSLDIKPTIRKRLKTAPYDPELWQLLCDATREDELEELINETKYYLNLEEIASGIADVDDNQELYEQNYCLTIIVNHLGFFPGAGEELIICLLNNPVTYGRVTALQTIELWPKDTWSESLKQELQKLRKKEPSDRVKPILKALLEKDEEA